MDKRTIDAAKECGKRITCIECPHDNEHNECLMRDTGMITSALHVAETAEYYEAKIEELKKWVKSHLHYDGYKFYVQEEALLDKIKEIMEDSK